MRPALNERTVPRCCLSVTVFLRIFSGSVRAKPGICSPRALKALLLLFQIAVIYIHVIGAPGKQLPEMISNNH